MCAVLGGQTIYRGPACVCAVLGGQRACMCVCSVRGSDYI